MREAQGPGAQLLLVLQGSAPVHMLSPGDAEVIFFSGVIQHLWEGGIHLCPLFWGLLF